MKILFPVQLNLLTQYLTMSNLCIAGWNKVKMQFIYNHNATETTIIFKEQVSQSCNKLFSQSVINMFGSLGIKSYLVWLNLTFCKIKWPSLNFCSLESQTAMDWDKKKYSKTGKLRIGSSRTSNVNTKQFTSGVVGRKEIARTEILDKHWSGSLEQIYKKDGNKATDELYRNQTKTSG